MTSARSKAYADAMEVDLHPILRMLVFTFPDAFEVENDHSLIVLDREKFADVASMLGSSAPAPAEVYTCRLCHETEVGARGATCAECREREHAAALRARHPQALPPQMPDRPAPSTLVHPRPAPAPQLAPTPAIADVKIVEPAPPKAKVKSQPAVPVEAPPKDPPIVIGGWREGMDIVLVPDTLTEIQTMFADGIPEAVPLLLHPNVLELWAVDLEFATAVVRSPNAVSVDETVKDRGYPVLRFRRGDLYVVVGFKERQRPAVLGVYALSLLEHSSHDVGHTGGGGNKTKTLKPPAAPEQLIKRLQQIGVVCAEPDDKGIVALTYEGESLGKVRGIGPATKQSVLSDYDRTLRRVQAINRRQDAQAGRAS